MIAFPVIERVTIKGYGLYPGREDSGELDIELGNGPWLILGVNGLGKSTLLLMMRFLLAGPVRTRSAGFAGERDDLQAVNNRFFAIRVQDGAQTASARIKVRIGAAILVIERALSNLSITDAFVEETAERRALNSEDDYRLAITNLIGVAQFEDVVRTLDHLLFYLEARQPLIWDGAAQFELFRGILTPTLSADLRRLEGEIVSADSAARNLHATLYKITQRREKEAIRKVNADDTRARIAAAQGELDALRKTELSVVEALENAELERSDHRLHVKRSEQEIDAATQAYEKLKFEALRQAFAGVNPTEQYIFLKMLSDRICVACNQPAAEASAELQARHDAGKCVICGNPREFTDNVENLNDAIRAKSLEAFTILEEKRTVLELQQQQYSKSLDAVLDLQKSLDKVRLSAEEKTNLIRRLRKNLPDEENLALGREEERIATLRREVETFRHEREAAERSIDQLLTQLKTAAERVRERLETAFNARAEPFFAEQVRLVYSPRTAKIGQGGRSFEFPAFEVEMTSGATASLFVRRTPESVSLSQKEYLDLIFRMVLIQELGGDESTLAIDGPEGSLDVVFAGRAGDLFSKFSKESSSNVLLACNIVEGGFIPQTLAGYNAVERVNHVINLLEQAMPTQALTDLRPLYLRKVNEILTRDPEE